MCAQLQFTCMCDDFYQKLQTHIATVLQIVHPAINCILSVYSLFLVKVGMAVHYT